MVLLPQKILLHAHFILAPLYLIQKILKKFTGLLMILNIQKLVSSVAVSEYVVKYVASLVRATRPTDEKSPAFVRELLDWGAGPRAGQFLLQAGKAIAAMDGRFSVAIADIRRIAVPVLRHRLSANFQAQAEGMTTDAIVLRLLKEIREPDIPKFATQDVPPIVS